MENNNYEKDIARKLRKKRKTLAIAESCTGGLVSDRITNVAGSSKYFKGGVVAYSNDIKASLLGVPEHVLRGHGAVSAKTAQKMAEGVKVLMKSDVSAAITGIAGPSGGSAEKPVGLAYIDVFSDGEHYRKKVRCKGDRNTIKKKFSGVVLEILSQRI